MATSIPVRLLLEGRQSIDQCADQVAVNISSSSRCFTNLSKWFDTNVESAGLSRSFSTTSSDTLCNGSDVGKYWVCTRCRRATTDPKHSFGRINKNIFYCCNTCWRQFRLQLCLGMIFRMLQVHLCFTTLWIQSPTGVFLGVKQRNHTEWAVAIAVLVVTVSLYRLRLFSGQGVTDGTLDLPPIRLFLQRCAVPGVVTAET